MSKMEVKLDDLYSEAMEILVKDVAIKLKLLDEMESKRPEWWISYVKDREKMRTEYGAMIYTMGVLYYKKSKEESEESK